MSRSFAHIDVWLFDLDLTLYDPEHAIMGQVRDRIATFVAGYFKVSAERAHEIALALDVLVSLAYIHAGNRLNRVLARPTVRRRLDLARPVDPAVVQECLEIAVQGPAGSYI